MSDLQEKLLHIDEKITRIEKKIDQMLHKNSKNKIVFEFSDDEEFGEDEITEMFNKTISK